MDSDKVFLDSKFGKSTIFVENTMSTTLNPLPGNIFMYSLVCQ